MTSLGGLLWIIAIGALVFFMMKKGGGCCGSGHDNDKGNGPNKKELEDHNQDNSKEHSKGGCCG